MQEDLGVRGQRLKMKAEWSLSPRILEELTVMHFIASGFGQRPNLVSSATEEEGGEEVGEEVGGGGGGGEEVGGEEVGGEEVGGEEVGGE